MIGEHNQQIAAYLATLLTLVLVFAIAMIVSAIWPQIIGKIEAYGLGTITGGLIGVLRLPQQRTMTIDNEPNDPVPTTRGATK